MGISFWTVLSNGLGRTQEHRRTGDRKLVLSPDTDDTRACYQTFFETHPSTRFPTDLDTNTRIYRPLYTGSVRRIFTSP